MLEETVREWTADWVAEGLEQGRAEERALLCRLAARKFDAATGQRLAAALAEVTDAERLAEVGDWIIECGTADELLARVARRGSCQSVERIGRGNDFMEDGPQQWAGLDCAPTIHTIHTRVRDGANSSSPCSA